MIKIPKETQMSFYVEGFKHSFPQGWNSPFSEGTPPFWVPPLSEANLKSYPLFLRAIQIGTCKLREAL